MKSLNVKVGDKGCYRDHGECEVVFVHGSGRFVTSSPSVAPQTYNADGSNVRSGGLRLMLARKTVRVAVWMTPDGYPNAAVVEPMGKVPKGLTDPQYVTFEVPR